MCHLQVFKTCPCSGSEMVDSRITLGALHIQPNQILLVRLGWGSITSHGIHLVVQQLLVVHFQFLLLLPKLVSHPDGLVHVEKCMHVCIRYHTSCMRVTQLRDPGACRSACPAHMHSKKYVAYVVLACMHAFVYICNPGALTSYPPSSQQDLSRWRAGLSRQEND